MAKYILLLLVLGAQLSISSRATLYAHIHLGGIGLKKALVNGDAVHLKKLSENAGLPAQRRIARVAYLMSRMRLQDAVKKGMACFNSDMLTDARIQCSIYAASAALADQKVAQWARIVVSAKSFAYPYFKKVDGKDLKIAAFERANVKNFTNVPQVTVQQDEGATLVPWVANCPGFGPFSKYSNVRILINHHSVCAGVDTGSHSVLTRNTAKKLGLKFYPGHYNNIAGFVIRGQPSKTRWYRASLAVADSMKVGRAIIKNAPFLIVKSPNYHLNIIGSDTLQQLNNVTFTSKGLIIRGSKEQRCNRPMVFAFGTQEIPALHAVVNKRPTRVQFDSGQEVSLSTASKKFVDVKKINWNKPTYVSDTFGELMNVYYQKTSFSSSLKQRPSSLTIGYNPDTPQSPSPITASSGVTAGFGVLKKYNVELNFHAHKSCFIPAG